VIFRKVIIILRQTTPNPIQRPRSGWIGAKAPVPPQGAPTVPRRHSCSSAPSPLDLPAPLDELVRQLLDRTHGRAAVARTHDQPWVFPGGAPGHPLSTAQLKVRLARLGIHGRSGRNTTLMDPAAKVPPVALARLLGIHISTAGAWAERAGGSPAAYAAQVFRRTFSKF
jgi:hypothetical protein